MQSEFMWLCHGTMTDFCEHSNELSGSMRGQELIEYMSGNHLLKKGCMELTNYLEKNRKNLLQHN
jgi:hypothetical protein